MKKRQSLLGMVYERAPMLVVLSLILGLVAGACYSFIIPFLLHGIELNSTSPENIGQGGTLSTIVNQHYVEIFFLICTAIVAARAISIIVINVVVKIVAADLRVGLCRKICRARVRDVENIGIARLLNILMDDIHNISFAAVCMPMLCIEVVTIAGLMGYLAYLDWRVFSFILAAVLIGVALFHLPMRLSMQFMDKSRRVRDRVQSGIRGVLYGMYELKLNREKAERYISEEVEKPERQSVKYDNLADAIMHTAGNFGTLLSFIIIGLVAFVLPNFISFASAHIYGIVMVLLYLIGPIAMSLNLFPNIQRGNIALSHIASLRELEEEAGLCSLNLQQWREYRVNNISYDYSDLPSKGKSSQDTQFSLKNISLTFRPSEIVFIVGGNGSGKSTLAKILSLHYIADAGDIYFDGIRVTEENINDARDRFSVIYSNYFLFEKLYKTISEIEREKVSYWMKEFQLDSKTGLEGDKFTTTDLSDGQRRRLALLVALMEDRDIYLFDEWAADQDPEFKEAFYKKFLPHLKSLGKLVIAITHDDRYFSYADRVVTMEDGGLRMTPEQAKSIDVQLQPA